MPIFIDPECEVREATEAEDERDSRAKAVADETNGMYAAFIALRSLDYNARKRALRWLTEALENCEVPF